MYVLQRFLRVFPVLVVVALAGASAAVAQTFDTAILYPAGPDTHGVAAADLNHDNHVDLVVTSPTGGYVRVRLGDGTGTLGTATDFPTGPGTSPLEVVVADFNGDTHPDIATANSLTDNVSILLGNGSGGFGTASQISVGDSPVSLTAADFNGDGFFDLAVANQASSSVSVLMATGSGTFNEAAGSPLPTGTGPIAVRAGDVNIDGAPDFVTADNSSGTVTVYINSGGGTFVAGTGVSFLDSPTDLAFVDFNNDGLIDRVIVSCQDDDLVQLLGFDESFALVPVGTVPTGDAPRGLTVADFNGDGVRDVAVVSQTANNLLILLGDLGSNLAAGPTVSTGGTLPMTLATADFNGDEKPDLAVGQVLSNDTGILLNTSCCTVHVTLAGTGSGLVSSVAHGISCAPDCTGFVAGGSPIDVLQTVPADGSLFSGFSCDGGPCNPTIDTDVTITATFDAVVSTLTPATLPDGTVGVAYSQLLTIGGNGTGPYIVNSSNAPPGLDVTLDSLTVTLEGTPTQGGVIPFTMVVSDLGTGAVTSIPFTLTVAPTASTTSAGTTTAIYNANSQTVTLTASVGSSVQSVESGTVTFTVRDAGSNVIGVPVTSGPVAGGVASATYTLPGGTNVQPLSTTAVFNGQPTYTTSSGVAPLTLSSAPSTTTGANATAPFSAVSQVVPLSATVTSPNGTVNNGTMSFTVRNSGNAVIGSAVTTVTGGAATANFTLPANTAPQTLTITASYLPTAPLNFSASSDTIHTLTVVPAATTTSAVNALAAFNSAAQSVGLSANVSSTGGVVNAGTVTFTVRDGSSVQIGVPVTSGTVSGGTATAIYTLPAGTNAQTLTITAVYGGSTNFATSTDAAHTLTIGGAPSTTAATNATATLNAASQSIPLTASVTSAAGTVSGGTVTFTVRDVTNTVIGAPVTSGPVAGGAAAATFTLPGGTGAQTLTITAGYSGSPNFLASTDATHTLVIGPAATATTTTGGSVGFSFSPQNIPLTATVTSSGGTVGAGSVTFTVLTASLAQVGAGVTAPVSGGTAGAIYVLPGATSVQGLTVRATYNASTNFTTSTGTAPLTVGCVAIDMLPATAPPLRVGLPFSLTFTAPSVADAAFSILGTLPPGLTVNGATLSGTPTTTGQFPLTVTVTSAAMGPCPSSRVYTFFVQPRSPFVTGAGGGSPRVRTFDAGGTMANAFLADDPAYAGGIRVAMGDVTGDGVDDIITARGRDAATPLVRVLDGVTGAEIRQFVAYPFASPGGTYVAAADINGDGRADIVTGRDGAPPEVKVFDGRTGAVLSDFFAYPEAVFGGVRVAAGDVDGDGFAEIITAPPAGAPPLVRVFGGTGVLRSSFMAYNPLFFGGVYVAAGDIDGDGRADIVTGADTGGGPHVMAFSGADLHVLRSFFAYSPFFTGGVRVAAGDVNGDGHAEIITAAGPGGGPHVRVWDGVTGAEVGGFFAYESTFADGVFVAAPPAQSRMEIGVPGPGATVPPTFNVSGWAAMAGATVDSGFDAIHAWLLPVTGGVPIFGGATTVGVSRPDVAALFGGNFANAGFNITVGGVPPGTYDLVVYPHSSISGTWGAPRVVRIVVTP